MEKTRVSKGEKYYYIDSEDVITLTIDDYTAIDNIHYNLDNYFSSIEEAEEMARKLRAVLKGADVIEMPSGEEISKQCDSSAHKMDIDDDETPNSGLYWRGWNDAVLWLKSKIVK